MRLGEEHEELAAVRSLLARHEGGAAWRPLVQQIGVTGLGVPECGAPRPRTTGTGRG
ncbi:hypothetical protein [Streptomyces sp. SID14478]|uniref:hypothetical protein n=1 Tax=Streptomyces sp. SID14478 TaxID=2706073 RepID=UPI001945057E|nr:hypothetical protein [Streptomyces sp. SID14478]